MPETTLDNPLKRFDITASEIDRVVTVFYAHIRRHPDLGPVFGAHLEDADWPEHEDKIARFWRNAILREKSYNGNPMRVHLSRPDVKAEHFPLWLGLFHQVLKAELPEPTASSWGVLADRIGEGFRAGIVSMRQPKDEPPKLF
ncbi:group III truncated hemoglobin [Parasedimentitalea maritima]|uniref:Globin family protein n=1 Tax=Parasedimentitalea maritima TaxID=2578117 RepID=A0A5R8ZNB2_9RHOB|nr:group III truncated hemoglobin [Zongyanglinia marina]KAE9630539.1 globin family protein [Zongyanglinia marina]TLP67298.1 group III truncated hemoglobin [Zongyanglinia marina]